MGSCYACSFWATPRLSSVLTLFLQQTGLLPPPFVLFLFIWPGRVLCFSVFFNLLCLELLTFLSLLPLFQYSKVFFSSVNSFYIFCSLLSFTLKHIQFYQPAGRYAQQALIIIKNIVPGNMGEQISPVWTFFIFGIIYRYLKVKALA